MNALVSIAWCCMNGFLLLCGTWEEQGFSCVDIWSVAHQL